MTRWISRAPIGAVTAVVSVIFLFAGCPRAQRPAGAPTSLHAAGVRIEPLAQQLGHGPGHTGRAGDWLVASDRLRLVVGALRGSAESLRVAGTLLDVVTAEKPDDKLEQLRVGLQIAGADRQLQVVSVMPVAIEGGPALRIVQRDPREPLEVETDIVLRAGASHLTLVTRVTNRGSSTVTGLRVADQLRWLGDPAFAPGYGFVGQALRARVDWLAFDGQSVAYALTSPVVPFDVEFRTTGLGPREQMALSAPATLAPNGAFEHRRYLIAASGRLETVAELAWTLAGRAVGFVEGKIAPMPPWARIEARGARNETLLVVSVKPDGTYRLPLPAGSHRLRLVAPGGTDEESVQVGPAATVRVSFIVPQPKRLRYRVVDAATGEALAARLTVRGIAPTPDPNLGPWHVADGAANVAYTASGEGALELPPGRYKVLASHGLEWSVFEQEVDVTEAFGAVMRVPLARAFPTAGWLACDFHLHADPSGDSEVPLRDRVIALLAEGIEFAVATDHNHVTDYGPSISELGAGSRINAARGVEITTSGWGHFNAYPLPAAATAPKVADLTPAEIFGAVRSSVPDSVIQINHPRMGPDIGYFTQGQLDVARGSASREGFTFDFDAIEVHNGFEHNDFGTVERNLLDWFTLLQGGRRYTAVGNSDSHALVMQWAGYPRTYVRTNSDRPDAVAAEVVARSVRLGRAIVTSGPFIELRVNDGEPGDHVTVEAGKARIDLSVHAADWVDVRRVRLIANAKTLRELEVPAERKKGPVLRFEGDVKFDHDAWLVVIAQGERPSERVLPGWQLPPIAFTNPVWIDVDGDGLVTSSPSHE
jgi:hypothetical protein